MVVVAALRELKCRTNYSLGEQKYSQFLIISFDSYPFLFLLIWMIFDLLLMDIEPIYLSSVVMNEEMPSVKAWAINVGSMFGSEN